MGRAAERKREKVSATLPPALIKQVQQYQKQAELPNFSAAVEELLGRELLEDRTRAYYLSMSREEIEEQRAWASFATAQASQILPEG